MKNFTFLFKISILLLSLVTCNVNAKTIKTNQGSQTELQLLSSSELNLIFLNKVGSINTEFVNMEGQDYVKLVVAAFTKSTVYGDPELPVRRRLIEIPHEATPVVQIINYDVAEYDLADYGVINQILPLQYSVPKCGDAPEFICNNEIYEIDAFINQELVTVDVLGIMRGTNIGRVNISPIFYNPVKNTIRVYENLEFEIVFEGADLTLTQSLKEKYYSPYFSDLFQMLENYSKPANRDNFTQYPIKYVIVSDPMFETQLQPFIEWKTRKGFTVVEAYTDVIGTTKPEIKAYIQGLYDAGSPEDPAPSFVLFVGDVGQIPAYENGNGETDRLYFEYTGDLFPEIFYGRFSAQNTTQLQPYIDKTLQYEQYTMPDPSYLEEVVMIAGMDSGFGYSHGNGQINYGTINYFNEDHDILSHTYLYPNSGSNAAQIRQNISDGVTFTNYTAHCSPDGWSNPSFKNSDIPALQNQDKYGLIIGNCCSSSEFAVTCFAEEILRAENKGAVGYIGGSNSTYWNEDYYFGVGYGAINENPPPYEETGLGNYDRSFHDHGEEFGDWFTTMDQVVYAGNLAVSESGSPRKTYYWDIYNLMGDPSLMIYYGVPDEMPVTHVDAIMFGQSTTSVDAVPYAYISITMDNVIHGVALADENGHADIDLEAFMDSGEAEIVVTAQNYQPHIATIDIIPPDGPFLVYEDYVVNDDAGNNNGEIDYAESILLSVGLNNLGNDSAIDVQAELTTESEYITMTQPIASYGDIPAGETVYPVTGFGLDVSEITPDGQKVDFQISVEDTEGRASWQYSFSVTVHAPVLEYVNYSIDDSNGNDNGKLDPGETANIVVEIVNNGSSEAYNLIGQLTSLSEYVSINTNEVQFGDLEENVNGVIIFNITAGTDAPDGHSAAFEFNLIADHNISTTGNFNVPIGQISVVIIDLSDESSTPDAMIACLETLQVGNEVMTAFPDDLNVYKVVFIILGIRPNNNELSSVQAGMLASYMSDGGFVYLEGSDAWYTDEQTEAHNMFMIEATSDGSGDLTNLTGQEGSVGEDFLFSYNGPNVSIDKISPEDGAKLVFKNMSPSYGVAVSFDNGDYKTIGTSFEFGGLTDSEQNMKDELMAKYLEFYEISYMWVGFEERETLKYKLYPNPSSGIFTLEVSANVSVEIRNTVGSLIYQNKNVSAKETIDLTQKAKGIYFVIVRNDDQNFVQKIVISK